MSPTGARRRCGRLIAPTVYGMSIRCDVAVLEDCRRAVAVAVEAFGRLDGVFANAAVGTIRIWGHG